MITSAGQRIAEIALGSLPFEPLPQQLAVIREASEFAAGSGDPREVFVLNGYAGTGKTSVIGAVIRAMDAVRRPVVVLAPTGRAAKVASSLSSHTASTIHRRIFRPDFSDPSGHNYFIAPNECRDTLFIVDEASLVNDRPGDPNSLLMLLIRYVYSAPGCRLLLMGDEAQLPPVGQEVSTAMNPERLRETGLVPLCHSLDIPVRQEAGSGIILNATIMRECLYNPPPNGEFPLIETRGFEDVSIITSAELSDSLADSYSSVGMEETLVITRSNYRANDFNRAIRNMVMFAEEPIERGDRLVVAKNDYYWGKKNRAAGLIANGEMADVTWVGKTEKAYGRYFTDVELQLSDGRIINANIMLRSLMAEGPAIPRAEMERFYNVVLSGYEGEISEKMKGAMDDPYYNALQAKYAYCVTCHKAQGGQWSHVYIDMGGIQRDAIGPDFFRWLYTAITRATRKVIFINPPMQLRPE